MKSCDALESIREINLSYLMLAQRLLREDRPAGMFRLGLSEPPPTCSRACRSHRR